MYSILIGLANVLMIVTSLFLICLVLIQRGKGGGLAGAFGGVGGSSAFGTKAGDVFTRVTIYTAAFWFGLALFLVYTSNSNDQSGRGGAFSGTSTAEPKSADPLTPSGTDLDNKALPTPAGVTTPPAGSVPTVPPSVPSQPLNPPADVLSPGSSTPPPIVPPAKTP